MADLMPGIPSVPGDETSWAAAVDQFETLKKGDIPLSLTNWDASTTIPAIAAGSAIEVAGGVYRYPAEQSIITPTATGTNYLMVSADNGACECTATPPIWRDDLNGWYYANALYRYTGHVMDWDGANAYTNKRVFTVDGPGGEVLTIRHDGSLPEINVDNLTAGAITSGDVDCGAITSGDVDCGAITSGDVDCGAITSGDISAADITCDSLDVTSYASWEGVYGSASVGSSGWVIPGGAYVIASFGDTGGIAMLDIKDNSGTWVSSSGNDITNAAVGFIVSDGVNYRLRMSTAGTATVHFRKIW